MQHEQIIYLQGKRAKPILKILKSQGEDVALDHLMKWHKPGIHGMDRKLSGTTDIHFFRGNYVMYYNSIIQYIGLEYIVEEK